ncbi:hypothetical protein PtB15_11B612 [Puccinia triticina]|nr:hypothetical protein PtB15_11B612 [Puccinia triticina]
MTLSNTLLTDPSPSNEPGALPARLLAVATLQILANSTQFTSVRPVSLSTLTDVAAGYLELIAQAARASADHSGRTQINGWDLSGVLESLDGPGALSGLHNWCIENLASKQTIPNQSEPIDKLAHVAKNLKQFSHTPSVEPITTLSFLPLTDAEIAALDRAGESDLEDDHPSPSSQSSSSQDDSDLENMRSLTSPTTLPQPNLQPDAQPPTLIDTQVPTTATTPWRSINDIPAYVPHHLPPFPGLERVSTSTRTEAHLLSGEPTHHPIPAPLSAPTTHHEPNLFNNLNPYLVAVPFSRSQLAENHGSSFVAPKEPLRSTSPANVHPEGEGGRSEEESPARKKAKLSSSLEGFLQTYAYMVEEKMTNTSTSSNINNINKGAMEESKFMRRNAVRQRFIAGEQTMPIHDSLIGTIPVSSIRANRWSAGWIPHPPSQDGRLLPVPELKPFGHTALPAPVTMPVPIQFPPCPPFHQPHPRIPDLIPRLFRRVSQEPGGERFTLISRMSRLGPPSELGEAGEPLPYKIKDLPTPLEQPTPNNLLINNNNSALSQPKYIQWGFHWPPNEGRDPLPTPKPPSDFKPPEFPGMPKTTAEKLRLVQRDKELAAIAAAAANNLTHSDVHPLPDSEFIQPPPSTSLPTLTPSGSAPMDEEPLP